MRDLHSIARALGDADVVSGGVSFSPPGHSRADRSGRYIPNPTAPNGYRAHSLAADDFTMLRDYIDAQLGFPGFGGHEPDRSAPNGFGRRRRNSVGADPLSRRREQPPADGCFSEQSEDFRAGAKSDAERTARALALWSETVDPIGTPVESYLARRGIAEISEAAGHAIRYHKACPFAGQRVPAMVVLVRNVITDEPQAIHRTALSLAGKKIQVDGKDRLALAPIAGGAVKLTPDESVTLCLGVAEGIETALSLQLVPEFGRSPVWALISASGVGSLPVLSGVEALWVAVDHDTAGNKAACAVGNRWRNAEQEVFFVTPKTPGADLNDLVEGRRYA